MPPALYATAALMRESRDTGIAASRAEPQALPAPRYAATAAAAAAAATTIPSATAAVDKPRAHACRNVEPSLLRTPPRAGTACKPGPGPALAVPGVPAAAASWRAGKSASAGGGSRHPVTPVASLHSSELLVPVLECALQERINRAAAPPPCPYGIAPPAVVVRGRHPMSNASSACPSTTTTSTTSTAQNCQSSQGVCATVTTGPTPFHALEPPSISPSDYLVRLARYSFCSRSVFVAAFVYLDRVAALYPILAPTPLNVHRLLVTTVLLATKSFDDILYDNAHFAKVGGLDLAELNALELDLLHRLSFRLHISNEEYFMFEQKLTKSVLQSSDPSHRNLAYLLERLGLACTADHPGSPVAIVDCIFPDDAVIAGTETYAAPDRYNSRKSVDK